MNEAFENVFSSAYDLVKPYFSWIILAVTLALPVAVISRLVGPFGFDISFKDDILPILRCVWRGVKEKFRRSDPECAATEYQDCSNCPGYEICHREEVK